MLKNLMKGLYAISHASGKTASIINDVTTLASGDPKKIAKRITRKAVNQTAREINKRI